MARVDRPCGLRASADGGRPDGGQHVVAETLCAAAWRYHERSTDASHEIVVRWQIRKLGPGGLRNSPAQDELTEAALLYEGIPVTNVTTMAEPLQALADAIEAKDAGKFIKSYGALTDRCNGCHQSMGRGFIFMRVPEVSPFADQRFAPEGKR